MKKIFLTALLFLCSFLMGASQESLKVISYNIWNGFEFGKDSVRKENLINWMKGRSPDVVALQELCAYSDKKLEADANSWGHKHSVLLKKRGYSVGLTSKFPIEVKEKIFEGMHHGALHCQTKGIEIFVVHLSPFKWEVRNAEVDTLLKRISKEITLGKKVLVCGDFNALSPIDTDWYTPNTELLQKKRESDEQHKHVKNLQQGAFSFTAMSKFYGAGLFDVCAKYTEPGVDRISCPTQVFAKNAEDKKRLIRNGTRIDYILSSYNLIEKCTEATIHNGEETYLLSDHYPVEVVFQLK